MAKRLSQLQYEPLVTPEKWTGEERRFSIRLTQILDDLYSRVAALKTAAHPVGSLYLSSGEAEPARLFGGVWESVESGSETIRIWKRTA